MMAHSTEHPCGYCKARNSSARYPTSDIFGNEYMIHRCDACKAFFLTPYPTADELAKAYDDSYYGEGDEKFDEGWIERILDHFRGRRADIFKRSLKGSGRVLDIGCGNGKFLDMVQERGDFEIHGIEMPGGSAERARQIPNLQLRVGSLQATDHESDSFDAISLFHVFEHLTEPKETLEIISRILKKDGVLIMSFPNIDSWQSRIFKGKWLHIDPPRHLFFFFTPEDFRDLMLGFGFEVVRERHFSIEYNPFGMQQSILNTLQKKRDVLYESLKGNKEYVREYSAANLFMQNMFFKLSSPFFTALDVIESMFRKSVTVEFVLKKVR